MQELTDDILLYHENYAEISSIDLSYSRSTLDFGKGFYLTSSYEQALNYIPYAFFLIHCFMDCSQRSPSTIARMFSGVFLQLLRPPAPHQSPISHSAILSPLRTFVLSQLYTT